MDAFPFKVLVSVCRVPTSDDGIGHGVQNPLPELHLRGGGQVGLLHVRVLSGPGVQGFAQTLGVKIRLTSHIRL